MGQILDKPVTTKENAQGVGNKLSFAVSSMQGWRCDMEDAYFAKSGLGEGLENWSFFAVFDGHAGSRVSAHCAQYLLDSILSTEEFKNGDHIKGIRTGFLSIDAAMREMPEFSAAEDKKSGGTTAVCALISPTQLYIANCGDSRAVFCRQGVPVFVTQDHKPTSMEERERIYNAGGNVMTKRINGTLAVSRALGDYDFKKQSERGPCEQLVSPEPEIFCQGRLDSDEFLVLACDGVWDVISNEDLCSFIHARMRVTDDLQDIANQVLDACLQMKSKDNMSIIIVAFSGAPKPTPNAIQEDKELEKQLEEIVIGEIEANGNIDFDDILQILEKRYIEGVSERWRIYSKAQYLEDRIKERWPERFCPKTRAQEQEHLLMEQENNTQEQNN